MLNTPCGVRIRSGRLSAEAVRCHSSARGARSRPYRDWRASGHANARTPRRRAGARADFAPGPQVWQSARAGPGGLGARVRSGRRLRDRAHRSCKASHALGAFAARGTTGHRAIRPHPSDAHREYLARCCPSAARGHKSCVASAPDPSNRHRSIMVERKQHRDRSSANCALALRTRQ